MSGAGMRAGAELFSTDPVSQTTELSSSTVNHEATKARRFCFAEFSSCLRGLRDEQSPLVSFGSPEGSSEVELQAQLREARRHLRGRSEPRPARDERLVVAQ